jgi:AraC family transcriptional regulator
MNRTHITIVNQAVDFIVDHLFEKITVDMIADHCCFSRYYFNRLFKSVTNENIYGFIKRLRIETAAFKLIKFPHLSITEVAVDLGCSSSNFAVLFKNHFGVPPSRFRSNPKLPLKLESQSTLERIQDLQKHRPEQLLEQMDRKISPESLPDIKLAYQRFQGSYHDLPQAWHSFCEEMERALPGAPLEFYGISYDDPLIAGKNRCLYDLCARATSSAKVRTENYRTLSEGTYLCYHYTGHVNELNRLYNDLFGVWMPHRGYVMGPGLCFERYHADDLPEGQVDMDLCVPVY